MFDGGRRQEGSHIVLSGPGLNLHELNVVESPAADCDGGVGKRSNLYAVAVAAIDINGLRALIPDLHRVTRARNDKVVGCVVVGAALVHRLLPELRRGPLCPYTTLAVEVMDIQVRWRCGSRDHERR